MYIREVASRKEFVKDAIGNRFICDIVGAHWIGVARMW